MPPPIGRGGFAAFNTRLIIVHREQLYLGNTNKINKEEEKWSLIIIDVVKLK